MKIYSTAFVVFAFGLPSLDCRPPGPPVTPTPTPVVPTDVGDCAAACAKMQSLGCKEGGDVAGPGGTKVTCEVFCKKQLSDNNVPLNPSCVKEITACDQIETKCAVGRNRL